LHDLSLLACVWAALFLAAPVFAAGISGGVVSAGSASITQSGSLTTVKQSSDKAVINWGNFSIGNGSSVRFVQPSASSIALNRVTGSQASVIQGALQANGQVWVLNPNGVLIAPGGQVVTGSFLATTRSLTDQQFMAGNYAFTDGGVPGASVINQGSIIVAEGGYAVLAGEAVRNEGYIEANLGQVVLGGAKAFTLDLSGDNTLAFVVTAPVDVTPTDGKAIVDNTGSIQAAGGRVLMTARAASQVVGQVINTDGVVAAMSAQMVNGKIVLDGGTGSVSVAGSLNASGKGAGKTGGAIDVNAQKIQVKASSKLDVSGDEGGGKIAIGGGGPNTRTQSFTQAVSTTIASGAQLDASALTRGDGGEIVVFTSLTNPQAFTQVAGALIARGGSQGGNGGFVETSGYRLDVNGISVNTLAPKGRRGLWLLDPEHLVISGGGTSTTDADCTNSAGGLTNCSTVNATDLASLLTAGNNVTLTAGKSIRVSTPLSWAGVTETSDGTTEGKTYYPILTLNAGTSITIDSNIGGRGQLIMNAVGDVNVNAKIKIDFWSTFGTGVVTINAGGALSVTQSIATGTVRLSAGRGMTIQNSVFAQGTLFLDANTVAGSNADLSITTGLNPSNLEANARLGSLTISEAGSISVTDKLSLKAQAVNITGAVSATAVGSTVAIEGASAVNINSAVSGGAISVTSAAGGKIDTRADLTASAEAGITLTSPTLEINHIPLHGNVTLNNNDVYWGTMGTYSGGTGSIFTIGAPSTAGITTLYLSNDTNVQASRININNPLKIYSAPTTPRQLTLLANQIPSGETTQGVVLSASVTGVNSSKLVISNNFLAFGGAQTISLTGTPASQATFTLGAGVPQTEGTVSYSTAPNVKTVVIDNSGVVGGGSGGSGGGETTVTTPVADSTAASAAAKVAAEAAAAKAAVDAAAAKAVSDAAAARAVTLSSATKTVVDQAVTRTVAVTTATVSAAVVVVPAPAPLTTASASATNTSTTGSTADTSSTSATTSTSTTSTTSTSTATTSTTASASTSTSTTTATTAAATNTTTGNAQSAVVTQEFIEPVTVAALSNTTSSRNDPGDSSAATTSAASGPTSQTATPASSTSAAPAAPALTPVVVSKDGADAGDFTLQTVKPPAPVTAPKQQARTTERVTNTPVSPGISLQSTQKTPPPSGSVLGREISGVGNSSAW
jgi:filamentous hemagglutinin family protein